MEKPVIKGTRWLLPNNAANLDPRRRQAKRLEAALRLNQPLATAYYLKEDLRQLWEQPDKATAATFLQVWLARAQTAGVGILQKMANTLGLYRSGILAYYDFPISTGPLGGTNNKIKTMPRQAYDSRDHEFLNSKSWPSTSPSTL